MFVQLKLRSGGWCVFVTFFIFIDFVPSFAQVAYYSFFITIFQIGWACVQISHLALIPQLVQTESGRTTLNGLRWVVGDVCFD
jgi:Na+/melibiose symporter-like transporter